MYILHQAFIGNFLFFSIFLFFTACTPDMPVEKYDIAICEEELLDANDYKQDERIDHILVVKKERRMYLYKDGKIKRTIPISLGKNPIGPKRKKGDNKTPEGEFFIHRKLCSPKYYRSLCISYPRLEDIARARKDGVDPGNDITIHAQPVWNADGHGDKHTLSKDWTQGCIAVTNSAMQELWYVVHEGMPITIR